MNFTSSLKTFTLVSKARFQFFGNFAETSGLHGLGNIAAIFGFEFRIDHVAGLQWPMGRDAAGPRHAGASAPVGHRWIIAAIGDDRLPDGRDHVVFHHAWARFGEDRGDDLVEDLGGAFHPGDFFRTFDRARVLQQFGGVFKLELWETLGARCRACR